MEGKGCWGHSHDFMKDVTVVLSFENEWVWNTGTIREIFHFRNNVVLGATENTGASKMSSRIVREESRETKLKTV